MTHLVGKRAEELEMATEELDKCLDIVQFTHQQMVRHDPMMVFMEVWKHSDPK